MSRIAHNRIKWYIAYRYQLVLTLFLIISPLVNYLHLFVSHEDTILTIFGFEIEHGFRSNQFFVWRITSSSCAMLILFILFFNLSSNWKYALLFPICLFFEDIALFIRLTFESQNTQSISIGLSFLLIALLLFFDLKHFKRFRSKVVDIGLNCPVNIALINICFKNNRNPEFKNIVHRYGNIKKLRALYSKQFMLRRLLMNSGIGISEEQRKQPNFHTFYMTIIVIAISGIWFAHYIFPDGLMQYSLGPFEINSYGFKDVSTFVWYISRKLVMILILILCYYGINNWWRYAILSPLILYFYQFWETFQDIYYLDSYGNIKVFPLVLLSIAFVLALSRIIRRQSCILDTYEQISLEIDRLIESLSEERAGLSSYRKRYKQILDKLMNNKSEKAQLAELSRLQRELQGKIV